MTWGELHELHCSNQPCTCSEVILLLNPKPLSKPLSAPRRLGWRPKGLAPSLRMAVFERDGYTCQSCKVPGGALDPHHILPRGRGGKDELGNLVSLHRLCHRAVHEHPKASKKAGLLA